MKRLTFSVFVFFMLAGVARAQSNSQIFGRVTDSSGGVLPGVTVTLSSPALLEPRVAVTSETGTYQFPGLPLGAYSVKFELSGFNPLVREGLQLQASFSAQINADLQVAGLQTDVQVTGVSPVVDVRSTTQGEHFDAVELQALPSGRDIYDVLNQTPGIMQDRQNIGGNVNGQQTGIYSRGSATNQGRWFVDGVERANGAGTGPWVIDFNAVEEVQIATGGADATMQTSGVFVNAVTKGGGDTFRGNVWNYLTDRAFFGSNNISDVFRQQGGLGDTLIRTTDYGGQFGGPIKRGRAWFWGSYGKATATLGVPKYYKQTAACAPVAANPLAYSFPQEEDCLNTTPRAVPTLDSKVQARPFKGNLISVSNTFAVRVEPLRNSDALTPFAATNQITYIRRTDGTVNYGLPGWNAGIWAPTWRFGSQQTVSDRFLIDVFMGHNCYCSTIRRQNVAIGQQAMLDLVTGQKARADNSFSGGDRVEFNPKDTYNATATYFLPKWWGAGHSLQAGYKYTRDRYVQQFFGGAAAGNAAAVFNSPFPLPPFSVPFETILTPDRLQDQFLYQHSMYFQDTRRTSG